MKQLPFLLLFILPCNGNMALFNKVKELDFFEDKEDQWTDQINTIFSYVMPHFICCHLFHDDTPFSNFILHKIFDDDKAPAVVLGMNKTQTACQGYVVLTSTVQYIPRLIKDIPKYADHRILVIARVVSKFFFNKLLNGQAYLFGDAETFIYTTMNTDSGYRLGQPIRQFELIDNMTEPWEFLDEGYSDYQGRQLKIMTANCSGFSWFKWPIEDPNNASHFGGIEMRMIRSMARRLNITLDYHVPPKVGSRLTLFTPNKWYVKPTKSQEVDMAFCGLMISFNKYDKDVPMSEPLYPLCFRFVVPRPRPLQSEWNGVFLPFSANLWFATAAILGITSLFLQRISIKSVKYVDSQVKRYEGLGRSILQLISILVLSSVPSSKANQGASRHILTWWSLFTVLLTTSFSSSLVSHLTNQRYSPQATEIKDFIKRGYYWLNLEEPDYHEILDLDHDVDHMRWKLRKVRARTLGDFLRRLKNKKDVLFGAQVREGFILPDDSIFPNGTLDEYETTPTCFIEYFNGYAFRTGSPFYRSFNALIQQYKEYGILYKIAWRVQTARQTAYPFSYELLRRTKPGIAPPKGLKVENLVGIFQVWAGGLGLSIIVFFLESLQRFHYI